jgi:hypothetical protein
VTSPKRITFVPSLGQRLPDLMLNRSERVRSYENVRHFCSTGNRCHVRIRDSRIHNHVVIAGGGKNSSASRRLKCKVSQQ